MNISGCPRRRDAQLFRVPDGDVFVRFPAGGGGCGHIGSGHRRRIRLYQSSQVGGRPNLVRILGMGIIFVGINLYVFL